ncbi:bifunctional 3,4-dihydroxy-2-butanone-4-phosphate synthase/GTP cyclohydrolase II [Mycoavidus sp. SF9855]|uniref:bifunctional 3,4-dihydroxy-2-butanone-4-phosphate synthase/GTP cyclohydrolase II n=1 Tax=Mycoavidus sp. SF9855 TaxID=2968475 RepID=UPI00211C576A|nr:bifunctional 3,4-dihydroxy-2-butanone-4-phosphate synthase/GTP cyclohydrolase II [Mycoavidus sp. SF9855]UUM21675.1 bifunctional 3,4-dihydroxy-2-butanone-4-phosphate synthase/GTP cyclohydrolase II [Mycoavidus sp. SF9855]
MSIASTQEIIAELKAGRMVILVDEEDRENEGDLMFAADFVSPEAINFMVRFARGLVCLTLTQEHCQRLNLPLMTQNNGTQYNTAFTVSIEAAQGVSTGISPADRARTIQAAVARDARAADIVQPGHIFPVTAQPGGVLVRAGHTEAGCDLTRLAGLTPAAVICEIINDDGTMARLPDLLEFAAKHSFKIGTIADLIEYRSLTESIIERVAERTMQTPYGPFHAVIYRDKSNGAPHIALVHGTPQPACTTLVRVHEPMSVLDLLETDTATHSWTLHSALQEIASSECGVIVLMNCSDSKEYLFNAFEAYNQPEKAAQLKHRPADFKTYGIGAQILRDLDVGKMHVLSSPRKLHAMSCYGLEVAGFVPMPGAAAQ